MGDKKSCRFDSRAMVVKCHREVARHRLLPSVRASLATLALLGIIGSQGSKAFDHVHPELVS